MDFIVRVKTIWKSGTSTVQNRGFAKWHDALNKAVEQTEGLRRCAEDPELTNIIGYRVEITEWLGANTYKTRFISEYLNEYWRSEDVK